MSLKHKAASLLRTFGQLWGIHTVLSYRPIRRTIQKWPLFQRLYGSGWDLLHPFDRLLGTDTSGYVAPEKLLSTHHKPQHYNSRHYNSQEIHGYAGSQPSIIRSALAALPPLESYSFVDLGCGKGRPLLVASEFPFRELIGVELSPGLAETAKKNTAILAKQFPERTSIHIEVCEASAYPFPAGNLVVFLYHPFGEELTAKIVARIESALAAEKRSVFVVYYNPVCGGCFDASPVLTRYFAASLPYATEERGYGPDAHDNVVIWQAGGAAPARAGADAQIEITNPGMRAELVLPRSS